MQPTTVEAGNRPMCDAQQKRQIKAQTNGLASRPRSFLRQVRIDNKEGATAETSAMTPT
jgi:hypothetical protein